MPKEVKIKCKKDGYKVVTDDSGKKKCVKMTPQEIKARQKGAKAAAKKRKGKLALILKKAQKTKAQNAKKNIQRVVKKV